MAKSAGKDAVEIHESTDAELADFERIVDLLVGEHQKVESERNRIVTQSMISGSVSLAPVIVGVYYFLFDDDGHLAWAALVIALVAATILVSGSFVLRLVAMESINRQRRTCEELAELVREAAPTFLPKMSLIRRAELKIRLSSIGIYDPLKYS